MASVLMERRRALMGMKSKAAPILPAEYQQVQYVKCEETSTVCNTGIYASAGMIIRMDAAFGNVSNAYGILGFLTGSLSSSSYKTWEVSYLNSNPPRAYALVFTSRSSYKNAFIQTSLSQRHVYTLDSKNGKFVVDNDEVELDFANILPTATLKVGKAHDNSGAEPYVYGVEYLRDGDPTVYKCVPCYRKSDDANGLYMTETETFVAFNGATTRGANV